MYTHFRLLFPLLIVVLAATSATASPIVNNRTGAVNVLPGPEVALQSIFTNLFGPGVGPSVSADQANIGSFRPTFETVFTYLAGYAGYRPSNVFGIFESADAAERVVFTGGTADGKEIAGSFSSSAQVRDFGWYLDVYANSGSLQYRVTSDDTRNPGGLPQIVMFTGNNQAFLNSSLGIDGRFNSNDIIIAIEDLNRYHGGSDDDFNDLVVLIENVQWGQPAPDPDFEIRLPEPASMAVWALVGLTGGALTWRRRKAAA
jgi:hypothetical protein